MTSQVSVAKPTTSQRKIHPQLGSPTQKAAQESRAALQPHGASIGISSRVRFEYRWPHSTASILSCCSTRTLLVKA